jgi:predicted permease
MFGVIDRLLLRPPEHVRNPDEVRRIMVRRHFINSYVTSPVGAYPDFEDFDSAQSFVQTATYSAPNPRTMGRGLNALRVRTAEVTASFFPLLGVRPEVGRFFTEAEDQAGEPGRAVLEYTFWKRQFNGDPDAVGRHVKLGDRDYTIVGVAPKGFTGADLRPVDVWVNLHSRPGQWAESRSWFFLSPIARLRPGVDLATAEAEATMLHRRGRAGDQYYDQQATILLTPLIGARGPTASDESVVARWLAGVAVIVLLIACANVANLLLARGVYRRRETAIRLALGVSRSRLVGQLLSESGVLAVLGGITGVLIARWSGDLVRTVLVPDVAWIDSPANERVLLFSAAATIAAGLLAGLVPALQASRSDIALMLKSGERSAASGSKTRTMLLLGQGVLSVVLLVGAGLFVQSVRRVRNLDMGFQPDRVIAAAMEFEQSEVGDSAEALRRQLHAQAIERLSAVPGIESVASTLSLPFWSRYGVSVRAPGHDSIPTLPSGGPYVGAVSPGYFTTMGMRLVRGRPFTESENRVGADPVVVVNQTMARLLWPDADPLQQCLFIGEEPRGCSQVIGVVRDMREGGLNDDDIAMQYFIPVGQQTDWLEPQDVLIRFRSEVNERLLETVRREIHGLHPAIRYVRIEPLRDLISSQTRSWRLGATLFTAFGAVALLIAAVGLYSLLAFDVAQRRRELGIRSALGAARGHLIGLILRQAFVLVAATLSIGLLIALVAGPSIESLLFRVSPHDPAVFGVVAATLLLAALAAAALPAHRATSVDPNETLRAE